MIINKRYALIHIKSMSYIKNKVFEKNIFLLKKIIIY